MVVHRQGNIGWLELHLQHRSLLQLISDKILVCTARQLVLARLTFRVTALLQHGLPHLT